MRYANIAPFASEAQNILQMRLNCPTFGGHIKMSLLLSIIFYYFYKYKR